MRETSLKDELLKGQPGDVTLSGNLLAVNPDLLADLDYWEVDPDWDGQIFRSAAQAIRPRKKLPLSGELALPQPPGEHGAAVRMVKIDGSQTQLIYTE
jgi:adenine-specific DNA-methyltransferase